MNFETEEIVVNGEPRNVVKFTKKDVAAYLDDAIAYWRSLFPYSAVADCYVDAFQSVRVSIFGEHLPEGSKENDDNLA